MVDDAAEQGSSHAYRAKLLNPGGGIETTIAIMASTLPEATQQVEGLTSTYEIEIWEDGQMVLHLPYKSHR